MSKRRKVAALTFIGAGAFTLWNCAGGMIY